MKTIGIFFGMFGFFFSVSAGYWQWGWGTYGSDSIEDCARFDWSIIGFGNLPVNEQTLQFCRAVLKQNPNHRFFIRTWPIRGIGKNSASMTIFDYYYGSDAKKRLFAELEKQILLLKNGIGAEKVCGISFCEELPSNISDFTIIWEILRGLKKKSDLHNWKQYELEIRKELGADFDPSENTHLNWWCRKYVGMINEIHWKIKEIAPDIPVFYWQRTNFFTADMTETPRKDSFPFTLAEIIGPEKGCDGLFVYAGNPVSWEREGMRFVKKFKCPFFSQLSTPSGMRGSSFPEALELARTQNDMNMGTFLYCAQENTPDSPRALRQAKNPGEWTNVHQMRWFGWDNKINLPLVEKILAPEVRFIYDLRNRNTDLPIPLEVIIRNRKKTSWFGGDVVAATLTAKCKLLPGKSCEIVLGPSDTCVTIAPDSAIVLRYHIRLKNLTNPPEFSFCLNDGEPLVFSSKEWFACENTFQCARVNLTDNRWLVTISKLERITVVPLLHDRKNPSVSDGIRTCSYNGLLKSNQTLEFRKDGMAVLREENLFDQGTAYFGYPKTEVHVFDSGYLFYTTPEVTLNANTKYTFEVEGKAEDGKLLVYGVMNYMEEGKNVSKTIRIALSLLESGYAKYSFITPATKGKTTFFLRFYRFQSKGKLFLKCFSLKPPSVSEREVSFQGDFPQASPGAVFEYSDATLPLEQFSCKPVVEILLQ